MSWQSSHKKILPYVVRIQTQAGEGTGFLFGYNSSKTIAAIATAAHVIEEASDWKQPIKIVHYQSSKEIFLPDSERVFHLDRKRDSASILMKADKLPFPKDTFPLMDPTKFKSVGSELGWVGFPSVAYPELCFFTGRVSAFLHETDCYLIDGVAINGVSGGPVFADNANDAPEIVGSISSYLPNRTGAGTLPGLLRAQDISTFQTTLQSLKSLDEARKKEKNLGVKGSSESTVVTEKPTKVVADKTTRPRKKLIVRRSPPVNKV